MSLEANKIVGAGNNRRENDFYPTPPDVTQALLNHLGIKSGSTIWEPACGDGSLAKVIAENGYKTVLSDIRYGQDFLASDLPAGAEWIITNPPFKIADKFIEHAYDLGVPFAFLLKSQYWHAAKRFDLFERCTPNYIFPLTWRPDFCGGGAPLMDMMWCVWRPNDHRFPVYIPIPKGDATKR